jgi:hypothetical protein
MRLPSRLAPFLVALAVAAFCAYSNHSRIARVEAVTSAGDISLTPDPQSPTGWKGGTRALIVANHDNDSQQWIVQAQQSVTRGEWRVRHVEYDNAPIGRDLGRASPYRWWLTIAGWCDSVLSGRPIIRGIEHAALFADPALQLVFIVLSALALARGWSRTAAIVHTIAFALLFPLVDAYQPGEPNDHGLALILAWASLLPLVIGTRLSRTEPEPGRNAGVVTRWFIASGVIAATALWVSPAIELTVLGGVAVGAWLSAAVSRQDGVPTGRPWIAWGATGAAATLGCYLLEYFPDHLGEWNLQYIHPLWGLAFLGLAVLVDWGTDWILTGRPSLGWRWIVGVAASIGSVGFPVFWLFRHGGLGALTISLSLRPPLLPNSINDEPLWAWLSREGFGLAAASALAPLLLIPIAVVVILRNRRRSTRAVVSLATGPVLVLLSLAALHVFWWSALEMMLLVLVVAAIPGPAVGESASAQAADSISVAPPPKSHGLQRWSWILVAFGIAGPGACLLADRTLAASNTNLSESDVVALVERDISHWLANRIGRRDAIVMAPPSLSTSLYYHGGLRVLGTPDWENTAGMEATIRIAAASSPDEGLALAQRHAVNFIVLPSWDTVLDTLVKKASPHPETALLSSLRQWNFPRWLRPVPYPIPTIPGFEGRSVAVFEVVDVQDNALTLSRLAEFFVEIQQLDHAAAVAVTLEQHFPNELGAWIARATVANAFGDPDRIAEDLRVLTTTQSLADAKALPWDRQVSYAIALAQGQRLDLARQQLARCLAEVDEPRLRFLTPQSLYRFLLLCKVTRTDIADPALRQLARRLLPPELREKVQS